MTSALVLAEPLRILHGGNRYEVVSMSLRTPEYVETYRRPRHRRR